MVLVGCVVAAILIANIAFGTYVLVRYRAESGPRRPPAPRQIQVQSQLVRIIMASPDLETAARTAQIVFPDWTPEQARAKVLAAAPLPNLRRLG
jgi:hypothetical protein